jgi:hypothetical protein
MIKVFYLMQYYVAFTKTINYDDHL